MINVVKPCPWCGTNEWLEIPDSDFGILPLIVCRKCKAQGPTAVVSPRPREERVAAILEAWNRMATEDR